MPENKSPDEPREEPGLSQEESDDLDAFWDEMDEEHAKEDAEKKNDKPSE